MLKNDSIEEQVESIYKLFSEREQKTNSPSIAIPKANHPESGHIFKRYIIFPTLVILILGAIYWFKPMIELKLAIILILLIIYIGIFFVCFMEIVSEIKDIGQLFKNPLKIFFEGVNDSIKIDTECTKGLNNYSTEALSMVKNRMSTQQSLIERRLGLIVGAISNLGILPGLISLVIALSAKTHSNYLVTTAIVVCIFYIFAYAAHYSLPRINFYVKLIESEIDNRN